MRRLTPCLLATMCLAPAVAAQDSSTTAVPATAAQLIASAVLPLPEEFRDGATVLGWSGPDRTTVLREGTGPMICLADVPAAVFHVACYHESLEPFMARGRELRASGVARATADSIRNAEAESGQIAMPARAALWSLTGPAGSWDPATNALADGVRALYVVYIPGATSLTTGLPRTPAGNTPWLMFPGTPRAHIMFVPDM
jgi:hypothetical protein